MKEKNIYLLKNLILFFLASFLPKTISFFFGSIIHKLFINYRIWDSGFID